MLITWKYYRIPKCNNDFFELRGNIIEYQNATTISLKLKPINQCEAICFFIISITCSGPITLSQPKNVTLLINAMSDIFEHVDTTNLTINL